MHWIDPDCLPATRGTVELFLFNPHGEADGLIMTDGTEVHFPPHMGHHVLKAVRPGGTVQIRGIRPRDAAMIAAVAVEPENGKRLVDDGPPEDDHARKAAHKKKKEARKPMEIEGVLRQVLHGPKGEPRGLLLEDGRSGRFPPHAAEDVLPLLKPGTRLFIRGEGLTVDHGTVVAISEIGTSRTALRRIEGKPPKKMEGKHHH